MERTTRCLFVAACQCLRSSSGRCQRVCSIISSFFQSGSDLPVDVNFCRMPRSRAVAWTSVSAPSHTHPTNQHCLRCTIVSHLQETSSNTHGILTIRPDLKVSVLHSHRSDCRRKLRTFCCFVHARTKRERERFLSSPTLKKTPQPALRNLAS